MSAGNYENFSISLLIGNDTCKIMVGCLSCTYPCFRFLLARTLSRSRSVNECAHIQAFTFLTALTLVRSRSVARRAHIQAFAFSWRGLLRSRSVARRARVQAFAQKLAHSGLHKEWRKSGWLRTSRVATKHCVKHCAEITLCQHFLRPTVKKKELFLPLYEGLGRTHGTTDT